VKRITNKTGVGNAPDRPRSPTIRSRLIVTWIDQGSADTGGDAHPARPGSDSLGPTPKPVRAALPAVEEHGVEATNAIDRFCPGASGKRKG